jgi:hypothetical protein
MPGVPIFLGAFDGAFADGLFSFRTWSMLLSLLQASD